MHLISQTLLLRNLAEVQLRLPETLLLKNWFKVGHLNPLTAFNKPAYPEPRTSLEAFFSHSLANPPPDEKISLFYTEKSLTELQQLSEEANLFLTSSQISKLLQECNKYMPDVFSQNMFFYDQLSTKFGSVSVPLSNPYPKAFGKQEWIYPAGSGAKLKNPQLSVPGQIRAHEIHYSAEAANPIPKKACVFVPSVGFYKESPAFVASGVNKHNKKQVAILTFRKRFTAPGFLNANVYPTDSSHPMRLLKQKGKQYVPLNKVLSTVVQIQMLPLVCQHLNRFIEVISLYKPIKTSL
jgi:hypothetical protein